MKENFLLITGGTGGHVIPAKNFANYLSNKNINCTIITDKRGYKYFDNYNGKIYIADFFFTTCPGICPKLTKHMKILEDLYTNNDQIKFLSYTVMPWHDSVSVLNEYGKK